MKNIIFLSLLITILSSCAPVLLTGGGTVGYSAAQERTVGRAVDDSVIDVQIQNAYLQKDVNKLLAKVSVEVNEGRVLLTGAVPTQEDRVEAVRLAWQPDGVKEVINEITVANSSFVEDFPRDAWITTQVKTKLLLSKEIKSINYNVETMKGVVYLIGVAQDQDELDRATYQASTVKGVNKVVSHVRIKNDPRREQ